MSMAQTKSIVLLLPIVFSILSSSVIVPRDLGVFLLLISFIPLLFLIYTDGVYTIQTNTRTISLFLLIVLVLSINTGLGRYETFRDLVFIVATTYTAFICIFIIPNNFSEDLFMYIISRISAICVLIGLPIIFIGDVTVGWFELNNWRSTRVIPFIGWEHYPLRSVIEGSQNQAGRLFFAGTITIGYEISKKVTPNRLWIFITNFSGVILTHSRGAIGATIIGLMLIIVYSIKGHQGVVRSMLLLAVGLLAIMISQFENSPVRVVDMQSRIKLWQSGLNALIGNPIIGYGVGDTSEMLKPFLQGGLEGQTAHSGYLRMLLYTGLIGGVAYFYLIVHLIVFHLRKTNIKYNIGIFALCIGFVINQFMGGTPIFGVNFYSVLMGISFGYLVKSMW